VTGHCTCMAGLLRSCSHVGATLFAVEAVVQHTSSVSCTSLPNQWLQPSASPVEYAATAEIMFVSPQRKRKAMENNVALERPSVPQKRQTPSSSAASLYSAMAATGIYYFVYICRILFHAFTMTSGFIQHCCCSYGFNMLCFNMFCFVQLLNLVIRT